MKRLVLVASASVFFANVAAAAPPRTEICKYDSKKHRYSLTQVNSSQVASLLASGWVLPGAWWPDDDGDTWGNGSVASVQCPVDAGYVARGGDCTDANGNVNPDETEITGNGIDDDCDASTSDIANRAPSIALRSPSSGAVLLSGAPASLSATASDPDSAATALTVSFSSSLQGALGEATPTSAGVATLVTSALVPGAHTITMRVTDPGGLSSSTTSALGVDRPPTAPALSISPATPTTGDGLVASVASATDPDGDAVTLTWTWRRDGAVLASATSNVIAPGSTFRGEVWQVTATPSDGWFSGLAGSATVTIGNVAPQVELVTLSRTTARVGDTVTCAGTASDRESDAVTFTYAWSNGATGPSVALAAADDPGVLTCTARADDQHGGVATGTASLTVLNSPPVATTTVSPSSARVGDTVTCTATATDVDGDVPAITYAWSNGATTASVVLKSTDDPGVPLVCTATAHDAQGATGAATSVAEVLDTAPVVPWIGLSETTARVGQSVTCIASATDADGDVLAMSYAWSNGATTATITLTAADDPGVPLVCTATVHDPFGQTGLRSASVTVLDTPPIVTWVWLDRSAPRVGDTVTCSGKATDADGDVPELTFAWSNGATTPSVTLTAADDPGTTLTCTVTAHDPQGGIDQDSKSLTIANTQPVISSVVVSPTVAGVGDTVTCTVTATDADGDALQVAYSWSNWNGGPSIVIASSDAPGTLTCRATVGDPQGYTAQASATVEILPTVPTITSVVVAPTQARVGEAVTCSADAVDVDGGEPVVTYAWSNGATGPSLLLTAADDPGVPLTCTASALGVYGGIADASATVEVLSTPPVVDTVVVEPSSARVGDAVTCTATATDVDGDAAVVTYAWSNGATGASIVLTALDDPGVPLTCLATATDPQGAVGAGTAVVEVLDSEPVVDAVSIDPLSARPGETLTCAATAHDPDGDPVEVAYLWSNGATTASIVLSEADAPGTISCVAIAVDPDGLTATGSADATVLGAGFTVGGQAIGVSASGLVLQLNGEQDLAVDVDGAFAFATKLANGESYAVTIASQPSLSAHCELQDASGTSAGAPVTSVLVVCAPAVHIRELWIEQDRAVAGESLSLRWSTRNATGCTIEPGGIPAVPTDAGGVEVPVTDEASFTLTCEGPNGPASAIAAVSFAGSERYADVDGKCAIGLDGAVSCWWTSPFPEPVTGATAMVQVANATSHACGIRDDGTLWCWGNNGSGQLGVGDKTSRTGATQVGTAADWVDVATGAITTCGVRADGTLSCWGYDRDLGIYNPFYGSWTAPVTVGRTEAWSSVALSSDHVCAITTDGRLFCWGKNTYGQLGTGNTTGKKSPVQVGVDLDWAEISVGETHTCALKLDGSLWCWGYNGDGRLGDGGWLDHSVPTRVGTSNDWVDVDARSDATCAIDAAGAAWCWGENGAGSLGVGDSVEHRVPQPVAGDERWAELGGACGVTTDGRLLCWGVQPIPGAGEGPRRLGTEADWVDVDVNFNGGVMLRKADGRVYGEGRYASDFGAYTVGRSSYLPAPFDTSLRFVSIGVASYRSCGVDTEGVAWCAGDDPLGYVEPIAADGPFRRVEGGIADWADLSVGPLSTCGLRQGGVLACWGRGDSSALGTGDTVDAALPTAIATDVEWSQIDVGQTHACAIDANGELWCWGENAAGQVGDGTTTNALVPTRVVADGPWIAVDTGQSHTCALREDGRLFCWGEGGNGRLGTGDTSVHTSPVQVGTAADWVAVSAGWFATCGLKADGGAWCWGVGANFGVTGDVLRPVLADAAHTWEQVSMGQRVCGLREGGRAVCLASNMAGDVVEASARFWPLPMFDPL